ncbi:MAG TPA: nucleotidyltransferase family protein, partial [Terriglobales bacterium]|nr:nucleotidyltransferase family protein [Terriglobales bacterium]
MSQQHSRLQRDVLHALSNLVLGPPPSFASAYEFLDTLKKDDRREFCELACAHHVLLRGSDALSAFASRARLHVPEWLKKSAQIEAQEIKKSLPVLAEVCRALEQAGFPVVVMKSLDHWPDMGSDLDVFTTGSAKEICSLMKRDFSAQINPQSWSEKLACKFNFRIPGLKRLVEIHVGRLGQTGQQTRIGRTLLQRRIVKRFGAFEFMVPSPQDQLLLGVLDRLYRHHFLRICDVADTAELIKNSRIDFEHLKQESKQAGIRRGLASYLSVIDEYHAHYQGGRLPIPANIKKG